VIVDEAQELSAMAWRMVLRRNPARSLTVVGDVAQTGSPAGATSWRQMLDPLLRGRWREERLTVNYRTPTEIMAVAADVLASVAPDERPPDSVRSEGVPPRAVRVSPDGLAAQVARIARDDLADIGGPDAGRLAVIVSDARTAEVAAAVPEAVPGDQPESLDAPAALLTVTQAKGLEFDRVVLADPAGIIAQSPNGGHDLYVAITRATHRLTVVYDGELPDSLRALGPGRGPRKLTPRERPRSRPAPAAAGPNRPSQSRPQAPTAVPSDQPAAPPRPTNQPDVPTPAPNQLTGRPNPAPNKLTDRSVLFMVRWVHG
jgi:hypothetical protein